MARYISNDRYINGVLHRSCDDCGLIKDAATCFHLQIIFGKASYKRICKICYIIRNRKVRRKRADKTDYERGVILSKVCSTCKKEKDVDSFRRNRTNPDGYAYICTACLKKK